MCNVFLRFVFVKMQLSPWFYDVSVYSDSLGGLLLCLFGFDFYFYFFI
jgi:hypothetical protein